MNSAIACPSGTTTRGVVNNTSTVAVSCVANIIGYSAGALVGPSSARTFVPSNAYYVQAGPGTSPSSARNNLPTGRENNLDLTAIKRISITERYKLEVQAIAFNVLNHSQNLPDSLNTVNWIGSTGSGDFDSVASPQFNQKRVTFSNNARTMQLSGKIFF